MILGIIVKKKKQTQGFFFFIKLFLKHLNSTWMYYVTTCTCLRHLIQRFSNKMDDDQFAIHVNATILDLTISLRFLDPSLVDILFYIAPRSSCITHL